MVEKAQVYDDLPWQELQPERDGIEEGVEDALFMGLEELDGYEVVRQEGGGGVHVSLKRVEASAGSRDKRLADVQREGKKSPEASSEASSKRLEEAAKSESKKRKRKSVDGKGNEEETPRHKTALDKPVLSADWDSLDLPPLIRQAVESAGYLVPTAIQKEAIPWINLGRDVIGVAQTGSGKTLAYALPILSAILQDFDKPMDKDYHVKALMLAPTRELALQIAKHVSVIARCTLPLGKSRRIGVATVTGGLSAEKQKRVLAGPCHIIIGTSGRLWETISDSAQLRSSLRQIRFLVIDEADRMVEAGHFKELSSILEAIQPRHKRSLEAEEVEELNLNSEDLEEPAPTAVVSDPEIARQTLIFSATMSAELQTSVLRKGRKRQSGGRTENDLETMFKAIHFQKPGPKIVDLSSESRTSSTLIERKLECIAKDKDLFLYYFILKNPGTRALVFVNAIDIIRRVAPCFRLLCRDTYVGALHGELDQKQRLKVLDRFKSSQSAVLFASDVAARGLDVVDLDHVVHYQIPRSADTYIHRSGRTARAGRQGLSIAMIGPEEKKIWDGLLRQLGREKDVPDFPISSSVTRQLKERLLLARKIEKEEHFSRKTTHDTNWAKKAADEFGLGSREAPDEAEQKVPEMTTTRTTSSAPRAVKAMKARLATLLREPLKDERQYSARYLAGGAHASSGLSVIEAALRGAPKPSAPSV